ncbi:MAG: DUF2012 domain-containing protein, partial [Calditrichae bacterium]|nr:DUF2012 domain-containing protein [Calditrichia bacterium]
MNESKKMKSDIFLILGHFMIKIYSLLLILIVILVIGQQNLYAQTTGKIAGMVYDESNGEPAAGANVLVEGTNLGASVDLDGSFFILNVPPGSYTVIVEMIGYKSYKVEQLRVSVNRTAIVEARLEQTILEGEVIVVQADEFASRKDQTSSIRNISSKQMDILPVESIAEVINMQPGVVLGHFRGGRRNEVAYLIDGIQVDEAYGRNGTTVNIEKDAVEEVEVITGIFSAKYGNAMSGVVNVVTKDGGNEFHGSVSGQYANFVTSNKDIFIGLDDLEWDRQKDYQISLNGPIISNRINFAVNVRYVDTKGHLNGINRFLPNDYSNFMASDSAKW